MTTTKRMLLFIITLLLIPNNSFSQAVEEKSKAQASIATENYCTIFFGEGFGRTESDSINLTINNINIYENQGLYSLSYGSSPGRVLIIRLKKELVACTTDDYPEKVIFLGRVNQKHILTIDAIFRGETYQFKVDLTKGKFLVISASYEGPLEYSQHIKPPAFY